MAYAGATPWHTLGNPVSNDLSPEEMAKAAQCDWPVAKCPIYVNGWDGAMQQTGLSVISSDAFDTIPDRFALRRMSDGKVLDIVGSQYQPVQNVEALQFFTEFVSAGDMKMETAGSLEGGHRVWGLASIQDGFTLAGGDRVEGYLLLCNPHRQGEAFTIKFTPVRVVCHNTITMALNGGGATFRMSHANRFDAAMQEQAKTALGLATKRLREFEEKATMLSTTRVCGQSQLVEYVSVLSGSMVVEAAIAEAEATSLVDAMVAESEGREKVREARATRPEDFNRAGKMILDAILESPGADLPSTRGTWWGAVNGVTYAVDHLMGRTDDTRLTNAWFGPRAALKQQAVELAVQYASAAR
jgi:phage/plasmid-like protein (TIGR03299 family)